PRASAARPDQEATQPITEATVDFEMPTHETVDDDAAAAFLTQAFEDAEDTQAKQAFFGEGAQENNIASRGSDSDPAQAPLGETLGNEPIPSSKPITAGPHPSETENVAIKVLAKELASKGAYVLRFDREARVMVKLDHPNVIRCFDYGKDASKVLHYLAIEYVDRGTVESWLKKLGRFSIGDALHLVLK